MKHSEIYKGDRILYQRGHTSLRVLATYYWDYCLLLDVRHGKEKRPTIPLPTNHTTGTLDHCTPTWQVSPTGQKLPIMIDTKTCPSCKPLPTLFPPYLNRKKTFKRTTTDAILPFKSA